MTALFIQSFFLYHSTRRSKVRLLFVFLPDDRHIASIWKVL